MGGKSLLDQIIDQSLVIIPALRQLNGPLDQAAQRVVAALRSGNKLLTCGNGGSAADASHLATEFVVRYCVERCPYPAISLVDSGSTLAAIGNDYAFDELFARQVRALGRPGDLLISFSTSGNSPNVIKAVQAAKDMGVGTISFLGRDAGKMAGLSEVELIVPATQATGRIQEAHQILYHALCEMIDRAMGHTTES